MWGVNPLQNKIKSWKQWGCESRWKDKMSWVDRKINDQVLAEVKGDRLLLNVIEEEGTID